MKEKINDVELEEIAEQIKQGCTSGLVRGDNHTVSWNIGITKFKNN